MTAVIDIPDDLYQRVTKRSEAMSRRVPEITVELYERWLREDDGSRSERDIQSASAQWLEDWFQQADEATTHSPGEATARDILNQDRNRLEGK
jgi:hypothetical protein